jgi:hypothetical protein
MQETYIDRVIIKADFDYCQLVIPTKKDFITSFFTGLAAVLFGAGIIFSSIYLLQQPKSDNFYLIWIFGASIIWFFTIRVFLWNTIGKEIITIDNGIMTIDKIWLFFFKLQTYNLTLVKNLRTDFEDDSYEENKWNNSSIYSGGRLKLTIKLGGTFLFDYDGQTIKFGDSVDKDDADLVLQKLKGTKLFSPANLSLQSPKSC